MRAAGLCLASDALALGVVLAIQIPIKTMRHSALLNRALAVLSAWFFSFDAQADTWQECSAPTLSSAYPINIDVGVDAQIGNLLGHASATQSVDWHCTLRSNVGPVPVANQETRVLASVIGGASVWGTVDADGASMTAFRVNHNGKMVGIILWVGAINVIPQTHATHTMNSSSAELVIPTENNASPKPNGTSIHYRAQITMQVVKISHDFPATTQSISISPVQFQLKTKRVNNWGTQSWDTHATQVFGNQINVLSMNASCTTPSGTVNLGSHKVNSVRYFGEPMYMPEMVDVPFAFMCPLHLHGFHVKITPVPAGADTTNNILPLLPPSTAKNVGVQLFWTYVAMGSGSVGTSFINESLFNRTFKFVWPNLTTNGPPTWPLAPLAIYARIARLHPGIPAGAGTVHAAMKVVATYH